MTNNFININIEIKLAKTSQRALKIRLSQIIVINIIMIIKNIILLLKANDRVVRITNKTMTMKEKE